MSSSTDLKIKTPKISSISDDRGKLLFTIENCDVSVANALRRTLLSDIPTVVIDTEKTTIKIIENTTMLNNEILKQRLGCIPVNIKSSSKYYKYIDQLNVVIDMENTGDQIQYVTTENFKLKEMKSSKFVKQNKVSEIFPSNSITKDYIIFARLKPKLSKNIPGERLHIEAPLKIATAKEDGRYNVVSACAYGNAIDPVLQEKAKTKFVEELQKENPDITAKDLEYEEKNWMLLQGKQQIKLDAFNFRVETVGVYNNRELVSMGCDVIKSNCDNIIKQAQENKIEIVENPIVNENSFDVILMNEDYTMGKLIEYMLYEEYYKKRDVLGFVGFIKRHPHDSHSIVRMIFNDKNIANKENILNILVTILNGIKEMYEQISKNF
tara:strand:+ start:1351 stop:2493 length:1143 start_codon:yes stop_codon:yes gene_type:complete